MPPSRPSAATVPLDDHDLATLQALLDALPATLAPLDIGMIDGYLCGVLVQPRRVPDERWLPHVLDAADEERPRPLPPGTDVAPLVALLRRRHAELEAAIERRDWFDPWIFTSDADDAAEDDGPDAEAAPIEAVEPWVTGFAFAQACFPRLMTLDAPELLEPLALVCRHLDPDDLEDADDLLAEIESLEPPADLGAAVEELVRAVLLLADVTRPRVAPMKKTPAQKATVAHQSSGRPMPRGTRRR